MSITLPPLPPGEVMGTYNGVPLVRYTEEDVLAHAAAETAAKGAEIARLQERVRVLEDALRDAGDAIEWMYQCTAPASDDVEAAIRAARAALEQKP